MVGRSVSLGVTEPRSGEVVEDDGILVTGALVVVVVSGGILVGAITGGVVMAGASVIGSAVVLVTDGVVVVIGNDDADDDDGGGDTAATGVDVNTGAINGDGVVGSVGASVPQSELHPNVSVIHVPNVLPVRSHTEQHVKRAHVVVTASQDVKSKDSVVVVVELHMASHVLALVSKHCK